MHDHNLFINKTHGIQFHKINHNPVAFQYILLQTQSQSNSYKINYQINSQDFLYSIYFSHS